MTKKQLLVVAKVCLSFGLIYWLLKDADHQTIWESLSTAHPGFLIIAFLMFYVGFILICFRWRMLLRVEGVEAKISYLFKSFNIAVLFNNLLPSTIGGDAYRMYDVWKLGGSKTKAVSVILMDRFIGMFALIVYGLIASILVTEVRVAIPGLVLYLAGILLAMVVLMWMVFGSGSPILGWFLSLQSKLLAIPQRIVEKFGSALQEYRGRGDVLLKALLLSFAVQLNVIVHFVVIGMALNLDVPSIAMFIIIPVATLIMLLPVSINGLGVREAVLVFLFAVYGVSTESAIAFAWIWLAMLLAQGVVGGIVFMFKRNKPDPGKIQDLMES